MSAKSIRVCGLHIAHGETTGNRWANRENVDRSSQQSCFTINGRRVIVGAKERNIHSGFSQFEERGNFVLEAPGGCLAALRFCSHFSYTLFFEAGRLGPDGGHIFVGCELLNLHPEMGQFFCYIVVAPSCLPVGLLLLCSRLALRSARLLASTSNWLSAFAFLAFG